MPFISHTFNKKPIPPVVGGPSLALEHLKYTPNDTRLSVSGNASPNTPISASQTVEYVFDYITAGVGTGAASTISGPYGQAISEPEGIQIFADTGITLIEGSTFGNIQYKHPNIPFWKSASETSAGVAQSEGIARKVQVQTIVKTGAQELLNETRFSSYLQMTWDNGTRDTNNNEGGTIHGVGGAVYAWTNFPDQGGTRQAVTLIQNGQQPPSDLTAVSNDILGTGTASDYADWAEGVTGQADLKEFYKNWHGWGGDDSGKIWFDINGVRVAYPNIYNTNGGNFPDPEWANFIEFAFEQVDGAPVAPLQDYVLKVEIQSFSSVNDIKDRLGNTGLNTDFALHQHKFGGPDDPDDSAFGGFAVVCYTDAEKHLDAAGENLKTPRAIGSMWHESPAGDFIEFVPRYWIR